MRCRKKTVRAPSGTGGFELTHFGLAEKNRTKKQQRRWQIWTDALLVQNRALYSWAKRECSDSLPSPGGQLWKVVARRVWLLYRYLCFVFVANHGRILHSCLWLILFRLLMGRRKQQNINVCAWFIFSPNPCLAELKVFYTYEYCLFGPHTPSWVLTRSIAANNSTRAIRW